VVSLEQAEGHIDATFHLEDLRDLGHAVTRIRVLLDLDSDPLSIEEAFGGDAIIGPLVAQRPGLRVPGSVDGNELAIRAVLGQQVSLRAAAGVAGRIVVALGEPLTRPMGAVTHTFPRPEALAEADPAVFPVPESRRRCIRSLSHALVNGDLVLDGAADREDARARLLALPGIGPWTADYIAIRVLRDPDIFLSTDLGVRRALQALGQDPQRSSSLASRWAPYRTHATQHLWASLSNANAPDPHRSQAA
jgi:AraC family transcriptional regulator of adaptative response / DNA-3-methyladenine glycosylase II